MDRAKGVLTGDIAIFSIGFSNRKKFISSSFASIIGLSAMGMIECNKLNLPRKPIKKISSIEGKKAYLFKLSLAQWSIHKQIENGTTSPFEFASIAKKWGFSGLEYVNDLYKIKEGKNVKQKLDNFIKISNEKASQFDLENFLFFKFHPFYLTLIRYNFIFIFSTYYLYHVKS